MNSEEDIAQIIETLKSIKNAIWSLNTRFQSIQASINNLDDRLERIEEDNG